LWFAKNNTWQNSATEAEVEAGTTTNAAVSGMTMGGDFWLPACYGKLLSSVAATFYLNTGNPPYVNTSDAADGNGYGRFEYAPPSGYLALCTKNLGSDGG